MSNNNSKNSNHSNIPTNQSRNRRTRPTEDEPNEETSINTSSNNGSSYGTVSQSTTTYAPIKTGEQARGRQPLQRRTSAVEILEEENNEDLQIEVAVTAKPEKEGPVAWSSLPHKRQLIILTCARFSEPLVRTSVRVSTKIYFRVLEYFFIFLMPNSSASERIY